MENLPLRLHHLRVLDIYYISASPASSAPSASFACFGPAHFGHNEAEVEGQITQMHQMYTYLSYVRLDLLMSSKIKLCKYTL